MTQAGAEPGGARGLPTRFPSLSGRDLDGERYELPEDLSRRWNFVVAAFRREQQELVDGWLGWLLGLEAQSAHVAVYELPVLPSTLRPVRSFIDGGMARGVGTAAARARTITVYTSVGRVVRDLGLAGTGTIAVLLLSRSGRIVARELGAFEEAKARRLQGVLEAGSDTPA